MNPIKIAFPDFEAYDLINCSDDEIETDFNANDCVCIWCDQHSEYMNELSLDDFKDKLHKIIMHPKLSFDIRNLRCRMVDSEGKRSCGNLLKLKIVDEDTFKNMKKKHLANKIHYKQKELTELKNRYESM